MAVFIALLRAVNVSGTGKLPMKDLKVACEESGLQRVATYIASGNLVFESPKPAADVKSLLTDLLRDRFGLTKSHVILRTPADLAKVIAANPFPDAAAERPNLLQLTFLDGLPEAAAIQRVAAFEGPERLSLNGLHLYVDYAEGIARSKLTPAVFNKLVGVAGTGRNWNTSTKLLDMARALQS